MYKPKEGNSSNNTILTELHYTNKSNDNQNNILVDNNSSFDSINYSLDNLDIKDGSILNNRFKIIKDISNKISSNDSWSFEKKIYYGYDLKLKRNIAIKQILHHSYEAVQLADIPVHNSIVCIYHSFNHLDKYYFIMEYFPNTFENIQTITPIEIIYLSIQLLQSIEHLHANNWCHCDIKPSNIGIRKDANKLTAVLLDFDFAYNQSVENNLPIKLQRRNESAFQNPENVISPLGDIYSTGKTISYIVEKFNFNNTKLKDIINKSTNNNPYERYQNATEFRNALQNLLLWEEDNNVMKITLAKHFVKNYAGYKTACIISQWYNNSSDYNFDVPDEIKTYYNTTRSSVEQEMEKKGQWNGTIIGMRDCIRSKNHINEPTLTIKFAKSNYLHFKTMYTILQILSNTNPILYNSYKQLFGTFEKKIQPFNVTIGVHISIITNDSNPKLFFCERSTYVEKLDNSRITCGFTEAVQECDLVNGIPDLYETVIRGLKEELNISILPKDKERIKFFGCVTRTVDNIWGFIGVVDFRGYSSNINYSKERILFNWSNAKDSYEIRNIYCIPLQISSVLSFLHQKKHITQGATSLAVAILFYSFPAEEVNNAIFNDFLNY